MFKTLDMITECNGKSPITTATTSFVYHIHVIVLYVMYTGTLQSNLL